MKYEFIFNGNTTNEVMAHNRKFHLCKTKFSDNYRIDLIENKGFSHSENTGNQEFKQFVSTTKILDEQMIDWANYMLNQYDICEICGELELILPLKDYDLETFPKVEGKKVCCECRTSLYNTLIRNLQDESIKEQNEKEQEMKQKGYKYLYTFWAHPNNGDDFQLDIYSNKKLTKKEIVKEKDILKEKHNAYITEKPICKAL